MGETVFSQNIGSEMILMAPTTLKLNLSHLVEKKKKMILESRAEESQQVKVGMERRQVR